MTQHKAYPRVVKHYYENAWLYHIWEGAYFLRLFSVSKVNRFTSLRFPKNFLYFYHAKFHDRFPLLSIQEDV